MAREMSADEIETLVRDQFVARIGCHSDEVTYVVPVAYAYNENALYGFSHEGMKLDMMRKNPRVCIEIDAIEHLGSWRSVIAWGTFDELRDADADEGASLAARRLGTLVDDEESRRRIEQALRKDPVPVIFRIRLDEKSGRIEGAGGISEDQT